jgi:hypothetical protein
MDAPGSDWPNENVANPRAFMSGRPFEPWNADSELLRNFGHDLRTKHLAVHFIQ